MRSRPVLGISVAAIAAVALGGCIAQPDESAPPPVTIEEVSVPASLSSTVTSAELGGGIVAKSDSLPWIVGGGAARPGEGAQPTVWTSADGTGWSDSVVGEVDGSFNGSLAGSETLAALAGTVWSDGSYSSVVFTSSDGVEWAEIDVPAEFRDTYRIHDITVTGDIVYGIGTDTAGAARGVRIDGETVELFDLPEVADDELLKVIAVAASGTDVVLIARPGPEGDASATVSYRSTDAGATWDDPAPLADELGHATGVVAVGDGFVATGALPRDDAGTTSAAAWFSADGSSWTAESIPPAPPNGPLFTDDDADIRLGAPLARGGLVAAVYSNDNAAVSGVYLRGSGGRWEMAGRSSANSTNGADGVAIPTGDGDVIAAITGSRYARLGVLSGGAWTDEHVLAERENVPYVNEVYPAEQEALLVLSRATFTVGSDLAWRNSSVPILASLDGDTLAETEWDPPRAAELTGVRLATADDGSQIVIGSHYGSDAIAGEGWYRSDPDADWTPMTGFETTGSTVFTGAARLGDHWVAYGNNRATTALAAASHGMIWTSRDGTTWTRAQGDFGSGPLESAVVGVCALPDGDPIGVGWIEDSAGEYRTAVWQSDGSTWNRLDIGELGSRDGYGLSCATGDEGVILRASIGGRHTLLSSTDGTEWDERFRADRGVTIGEPVAVEGGLAASGAVVGQDFAGPVVWLSKTGAEWSPVSVPSYRAGGTGEVAAWGDDLIVTMSGTIGSPISLIRDIGAVIENEAP